MVIPVVEEPRIIEINTTDEFSSSSSSSSSGSDMEDLDSEDSSDDSSDEEVVVIIEPVIPVIPIEIWEVGADVYEAVAFAVEDFPGDGDWESDFSDIEYADSL